MLTVWRILRSQPQINQRIEMAFPADLRFRPLRVAIMATQGAIGAMIGEADVAIFARGNPAALRTKHEGREATAVQQEDGLFTRRDAFLHRVLEGL